MGSKLRQPALPAIMLPLVLLSMYHACAALLVFAPVTLLVSMEPGATDYIVTTGSVCGAIGQHFVRIQ